MRQTPSVPSSQRLRRVFPLSLLILAWPLVEIAAFVAVGSKIGILPTIGLVVLSGVVGAVLLRIQGFGVLSPHPRAGRGRAATRAASWRMG